MLLITILFFILILSLIIKLFLRFRYEYSFFPLFIFTILQKRNFKIAKTSEEIKETLLLSDKGNCIEELIAAPAWLPILSIESVNGEKWIELKKNYLIFQKSLPSIGDLGYVTKYHVQNYLETNRTLDSKHISILTLKIFLHWIFIDSNKELITEELLSNVYQSSVEYRKEIACKGVGCIKMKQQAIDSIVNLLTKSDRYKNIFSNWLLPENYSVVLQPFIISPMINVSDIAVSIKKYKPNLKDDINSFIDKCIMMDHPFPVLERYDANTNTQIFVALSEFKQTEKFNYGFGPRLVHYLFMQDLIIT
jgi:hypothetical protein